METDQSEPTHGCSGLTKQQRLAFRHCSTCEKCPGGFKVVCAICQWSGVTNDSKMMFRHYLQASGQKGKVCKSLDEVQEATGSFVNEMQTLWNAKPRALDTPKRSRPTIEGNTP